MILLMCSRALAGPTSYIVICLHYCILLQDLDYIQLNEFDVNLRFIKLRNIYATFSQVGYIFERETSTDINISILLASHTRRNKRKSHFKEVVEK